MLIHAPITMLFEEIPCEGCEFSKLLCIVIACFHLRVLVAFHLRLYNFSFHWKSNYKPKRESLGKKGCESQMVKGHVRKML